MRVLSSIIWAALEWHILGDASKMEKPIGYVILGIQVLGIMSIVFACIIIGVFGGGLDLTGRDFPGLSETCIILPISVILAALYPKLKNHTRGGLFLIIELIINLILATQALRLFGTLAP